MSHSQPWTFQGHLVELHGYNDPRRPDSPAGRTDTIVPGSHWKIEPVAPFHWNEISGCAEIHSGCSIGRHHGKSGLDRDDVHSLPRSIQDKTLVFEHSHN